MILPFLLVILVIIVGVFLVRLHARKSIYFEKYRIPSPNVSLIFGNTRSSVLRRRNVIYDVDEIYRDFKGKSSLVGFFAFQTPYILMLDANLMKICRKFKNNDFMLSHKTEPLMALNPFFLKDEIWKEKRRDTDAAVTLYKVKSMLPRIIRSSKNLVKYLNDQTSKNSRKIFIARDLTTRYTCDTIFACLYGIESRSFEEENPETLKFGRKYLKGVMDALVSFYPKNMLSDDVVEFFKSTTRQAIELRMEQNNNGIDDMLSQVISLKESKNYTEDEIVAHCLTLFLDSFETAGITLMNCLYRLGKDAKTQRKLRKELDEIDIENLTFEQINELQFLDQVFYETLRLHPALPFITRTCPEDWDIDGMKVVEGSSIWIPIHSIHRDPEYYYQPNEFLPERFNEENGGVKTFKDRCELIPFGDGLRICSGMRFAQIEVKTAIISIIKHFNVIVDDSTCEPLHVSPNEFMHVAEQKICLQFHKNI